MLRFLLLPLPLLFLVAAGCGSKPVTAPPPQVPTQPAVTKTGYTVQLGAFSVLANAVRLSDRLEARGEDVYYFRHESGLYKVRLGDYPTRQEALRKARALVSEGLVDTYWVVGPEDYALARARVHGDRVLREEIVRTARGFIGLPYQWGGDSPEDGFDCSGLVMASYQMNGLNIPRSSREQFRQGRAVSKGDLEKADLVFFSIQSGRKVSHVGLYAGNGTFIHAPGAGKGIRVDSLSNSYFRRRFVGARAYL
jgi:cell wall-associated NlpC family hydrolase